jgi:putative sigma-54 modulation protein
MTQIMNNESSNHKVILKGVHLDLTEALKSIANEKVSRLFRHEDRIVRVRVELEHDKTTIKDKEFLAKGHIEIQGPSLNATVATEDCLKSLDQLVDKLDRMIRRRSRIRRVKRKHPHGVEIPAEIPKV